MNHSIEITYFLQNCFGLEINNKTLLFDVPTPGFFNVGIELPVRHFVQNKKLSFFTSHYHCDHFYPEIYRWLDEVGSVEMIMPAEVDDAVKNVMDQYSSHLSVNRMAAFESLKTNDLSVQSMKSNDQGLAYLIELEGVRIYFGGDLAKWYWPKMSEREEKFTTEIFNRTLRRLKAWKPDIVFSNADPRLDNWSGAAEMLQIVKPMVFVPMHMFHMCSEMDRLKAEIDLNNAKLFDYRKVADSIKVQLH